MEVVVVGTIVVGSVATAFWLQKAVLKAWLQAMEASRRPKK
jgi:hypothetical protein